MSDWESIRCPHCGSDHFMQAYHHQTGKIVGTHCYDCHRGTGAGSRTTDNVPQLGGQQSASQNAPELSGARPRCGICGGTTRNVGIVFYIDGSAHHGFYCANCNAAVLGSAAQKGASVTRVYEVDVDEIAGGKMPSDQEERS